MSTFASSIKYTHLGKENGGSTNFGSGAQIGSKGNFMELPMTALYYTYSTDKGIFAANSALTEVRLTMRNVIFGYKDLLSPTASGNHTVVHRDVELTITLSCNGHSIEFYHGRDKIEWMDGNGTGYYCYGGYGWDTSYTITRGTSSEADAILDYLGRQGASASQFVVDMNLNPLCSKNNVKLWLCKLFDIKLSSYTLNDPPNPPTIIYPYSNGITYNTSPRVAIQGTDPNPGLLTYQYAYNPFSESASWHNLSTSNVASKTIVHGQTIEVVKENQLSSSTGINQILGFRIYDGLSLSTVTPVQFQIKGLPLVTEKTDIAENTYNAISQSINDLLYYYYGDAADTIQFPEITTYTQAKVIREWLLQLQEGAGQLPEQVIEHLPILLENNYAPNLSIPAEREIITAEDMNTIIQEIKSL